MKDGKDEKIYHSIAVYDDLNGLYDKFVGRKFVGRRHFKFNHGSGVTSRRLIMVSRWKTKSTEGDIGDFHIFRLQLATRQLVPSSAALEALRRVPLFSLLSRRITARISFRR